MIHLLAKNGAELNAPYKITATMGEVFASATAMQIAVDESKKEIIAALREAAADQAIMEVD